MLIIIITINLIAIIYCFYEIKQLQKVINRNAEEFNSYAIQNEKELQEIRNNLIPLYIVKRERDLAKALKEEKYEIAKYYEEEIENMKNYCIKNNCPL